MKPFCVPLAVALCAGSAAATQCSHTTCKFVALPAKVGQRAIEVLQVTHDNKEGVCSRYETTDTAPHTVVHHGQKQHCGHIKRWIAVATEPNGGHWAFDGPCECHISGTHPNGDAGLQKYDRLNFSESFTFNDQGNINHLITKKFVYERDGIKVTLAGWTHTRTYARGFLRNINGEGTATVSNLEPNAHYHFKIHQFDSSGLAASRPINTDVKGANGFKINGVSQPNTITVKHGLAPTAMGTATAKADGTIVFAFSRLQHHVDLSGIELTGPRIMPGPTSFNDRGNTNNLEAKTLEYTLNDGYVAKLSGWTHTRTYAGGFLRNKAGDGTAVVSNLRPGAQYKFHVYQYDSSGLSFGKKTLGHAKGANGFSVNGVAQDDTITLQNSHAPTASGLATAKADGTIAFAFTRKQHHVDLSGLSVHLAVDAVAPFEEAAGATNCAKGQIIDTAAECRIAATHVGRKFVKAVTSKDNERPAGCFWDRGGGGTAYFNMNFKATATWGGVGGLCRAVPSKMPLCKYVKCALGTMLEGQDERGCGGTCKAEPYYEAAGADNCPLGEVIKTQTACRAAADHVGRRYVKTVTSKDNERPSGCFWDRGGGGTAYFNTNLKATATWGGVGGLCASLPEAAAVKADNAAIAAAKGAYSCDGAKYIAKYPDLQKAFGHHADGGIVAASQHWVRHGKGEGRTCPLVCDWQAYLNRYADLAKAFGATNVASAQTHYDHHGQKEGRSCVPSPQYCDWQGYLDRYGDLAKAFGATNLARAEAHFMLHGAKEGRSCLPYDKPCKMVDCMKGWKLVGADHRGCGGTCEKEGPICCKAMTAACLSCAAEQTVDVYCAANPKTAGCATNTFVDIVGGANTQGRCSTCSKPFMPDEKACLAAAVKQFGSKVTAKRGALVAGSWGHVPSGCSVQSGGDWAAHFNRRASVKGDGTYTTVFAPLAPTNAIRLMNTQKTLNHGWYRVMEITAKDVNGKTITPAGARTDNFYGGWRKSKWAPELFDDDTSWADDNAVHFRKYATVWFDRAVAIGSLTMVQLGAHGSNNYAQSGFKWQAYDGTYVDAGEPMSESCCLAAGLAKFGRKVKVNRSGLVAGSWGHVPTGCSVQSGGDWAVHFNRRAGVKGDGTYTTVLGKCPNIPDEQMCLRTAVKKFGKKVTAKRGALVAGSWGHVPSGCSVQSGGDWAAHFNRRANIVGDASYTSVFA